MSKCVTIQLLSIPQNFPAHLIASNGSVYFDLAGDFTLSKSKNEESVSEFNSVSGEGVLGFSIPITDRNRAIMGCYSRVGGLLDSGDVVVPVIVIEQGTVLRQNAIRLVGRTDKSREYEVELIDDETFWKTALESVTLNELDFGTFELTEANLLDNWQNAHTYADGDQGVYFPLIHYGNWDQPATYNDDGELTAATTVSVEDFRPCFHVLAVLQKMFTAVGWNFRSPILETGIWRQRGAYIGIDYEGGPRLDGFKYRAEVQSDYFIQGGNGPNPEDDTLNLHAIEVFDNPGVYFADLSDPENDYYYAEGLCGTFRLTVGLDITVPVDSIIEVTFSIRNANGTLFSQQSQQATIFFPQGQVELTSTALAIEATQRFVVSVQVVAGQVPPVHAIKAGSYVYNTPVSVGICEDMTLPVSAYIRDYPALDFLAGVLHIIGGGRLYTDYANKTVWVYHPWRADIPGETGVTEAFYLTPDKAKDITPITDCKSLELTRTRIDIARYYRLAFADHDDYLESLGYENNNPAFAHTQDFGDRYNSETEENNNPFFEATGEIEAKDITPTGSENGVLIPAMWDDDDRTRRAFDVGPRIINFYGYTEQYVTSVSKRQWVFKSSTGTELPFAYLETAAVVGADLERPEASLAYGGASLYNSYELYWKHELATLLRDRQIGYLSLIDQCFFQDKNVFRRPYFLRYGSEVLLLQLKAVDDFIACENLMTPLQFALYPIVSELFDQSQGIETFLYLLEDASGYFTLEDGSGRLELE